LPAPRALGNKGRPNAAWPISPRPSARRSTPFRAAISGTPAQGRVAAAWLQPPGLTRPSSAVGGYRLPVLCQDRSPWLG
jgi:hypothetical protein